MDESKSNSDFAKAKMLEALAKKQKGSQSGKTSGPSPRQGAGQSAGSCCLGLAGGGEGRLPGRTPTVARIDSAKRGGW